MELNQKLEIEEILIDFTTHWMEMVFDPTHRLEITTILVSKKLNMVKGPNLQLKKLVLQH